MHELAIEASRLNKQIASIMGQAPLSDEVPIRLHSKEVDAGGAPEFSQAFLRYIDRDVCTCGRSAICSPNCRFNQDHILGHLSDCEPACRADTRFHASTHKNHPNRMKKALRSLRRLNPKVYDFAYLILALHMTFEQAAVRVNETKLARGESEISHAEFAVMWLSAASMTVALF
jgi:hypothetical protein